MIGSNDNDNDNGGGSIEDKTSAGDILGRPGSGEKLSELGRFPAPFGQEIKLLGVDHESGLSMLRINIREKRRFTIFDIDTKTARAWAKTMIKWADSIDGD